jgi:hypothetical protein
MAMGFPAGRVRRLLVGAGLIVAAIGGLVGTAGGLGYTWGVLAALRSAWSGAVADASGLGFHARPASLVTGLVSGVGVALAAMLLAIWRRTRVHPAALMAAGGTLGSSGRQAGRRRRWVALAAAGVCAAAAAVVVAAAAIGDRRGEAPAFFGAGALLLAAAMAAAWALLASLRSASTGRLNLTRLGLAGAGRRRGRSLAAAGILACGVFLIVAIGAFRLDAWADPHQRASGTGGFALIGESAVPITADLATADGRAKVGLAAEDLPEGADVVGLRVHAGDDASCLNLNRTRRPRLLGVDPAELGRRGAFAFTETMPGVDAAGWAALGAELGEGVVPAVGDEATVVWGLGLSVGDRLTYSDDAGRSVDVVIVATIGSSILQGSLLIPEDRFVRRFPSDGGYRVFLVDAPAGKADAVAGTLTAALGDYGLELTPTPRRLARFNRVQNTYLTIFQVLGALGLALGTVGLAVVVARNVMERRGELALLRAVGWSRGDVRRLLLAEHWLLLALGLAAGVAAAAVATAPAVGSRGAAPPWGMLGALLATIAACGVGWIVLATVLTTRGPLLNALRQE